MVPPVLVILGVWCDAKGPYQCACRVAVPRYQLPRQPSVQLTSYVQISTHPAWFLRAMSSRCKICGPGSTSFRVGDARPDCSGCSTIKEALSGYLKTPDQSISLNYHGEPPYAIQLYDPLGMTMLAWNSQPVTLTVTGSSGKLAALDLNVAPPKMSKLRRS